MEIYRDIQPIAISTRDYTYLPKVPEVPEGEGTFNSLSCTSSTITLSHREWIVEDTQGIRVEGVVGDYSEVVIDGEVRGIFRPHSTTAVEVTSSSVWGCQTTWGVESEWREDPHIDHAYNQYVNDVHYYARQRRVWGARVITK